MKIDTHKIITILKWNFSILAFVTIVYFILGELFLQADAPKREYQCVELTSAWHVLEEDGTKVPIVVPGQYETPRGEWVTIETTLPQNLEDNQYLCIHSAKQDMKIYVDGKQRMEYESGSARLFGKNGAGIMLFPEVSEADAGKTLTIISRSDSVYSGSFYEVHYGDLFGIWQFYFRLYGSELFVAFLTFTLGVVSTIGSLVLRKFFGREIELQYLGCGVSVVAVWVVTNSMFRQLIFPNLSVINDVTFCMIMLLPFPFIFYMNGIQKKRYEVAYTIIGIIAKIDFVVCTLLHVLRIFDFTDTFPFIAANCILVILTMIITMIIDIYRHYIREYVLVAIGLLGACIAAVWQIVIYFQRDSVFNGVIMAMGLGFLLVISVISAIIDISSIEKEKRQALSASEAKARFLARMSHEIRTPINAVLGMDAMILRESKDKAIREYALDIQNAGRTLLSLINDILDFSKIDSGKMELVCVEYDFSSMVHDIFNMISMRAQAKDLDVKISVDEMLPSRLYGDDVRIRQILVNLMSNAVKYTNEGSVSLSICGDVQGQKVALQFVVEDTGIGIRKEDLAKLFEEFERIEEKRNHNVEGTGLGMNITVQLLKMMDSSLEVDSEYGKGTKFSFVLEQDIVDREPVGDLEERIRMQMEEFSYQAAFEAPEAQILVVDDSSINRKVFKNLLKETKVQIDEACGGALCLELVQQKAYDIIFLDHMMPEMDGIEVLHAMQELGEDYPSRNTPVIALTANAIVGAKEMYLKEGFDDFLSKPIIPDKLETMLLHLLPKEKIKKVEHAYVEGEADTELELPEIAGINWEYALLHVNDRRVLWDTVSDFYMMIDAEADTLQQFLEKLSEHSPDTFREYRVKVHAMKSSAAMIGAVSLSGVAAMLEQAAIEARGDDIRQMTPAFLRMWRAFQEPLAPFFQEEETAGLTASEEELADAFELLLEALEEMDIDESDRIVQYLMQFTYPKEQKAMIEQIKQAVIRLDKEQCEQLIKQFTGERE